MLSSSNSSGQPSPPLAPVSVTGASEPTNPGPLGLIAGKGSYPALLMNEAKARGRSVFVVGFDGETDPALASQALGSVYLPLGKLGALIRSLRRASVREAVMAGQITPGRLFDLRPDWAALRLLLRLKRRNAETLFGAVADELNRNGVTILPATTYLEDHLASEGWMAGPRGDRRLRWDIATAWPVVRQLSALDVGQCVVVRKGTVLAVEGYDGTNATIRRGGEMGRGDATLVKASKPKQDFRFDVPVIGPDTLRICGESGIRRVVVEARRSLILDRPVVEDLCRRHRITLWGHACPEND